MTMPPRKRDWLTLAATYFCTLLSLIFILIRLICRRMRRERYWSFHDDMWMGISVVPLLCRLGVVHEVIMLGTNVAPLEMIESLGDASRDRRILGSKLVLVSRILYPAFLWCMKACILAFLSRLMSAEPKYARAIRIIGMGLVLSFISVILATLLECRPFSLYYQIPETHCSKAMGELLTMGIMNIVTDMVLICLPMPLICRSRLPVLRKVQLTVLFGVSFAVIIVTVVRMPVIVDAATMQNSRTLWASIEILTACIVANAPILNNFYFEWKNKRRGSKKGTQMADDDGNPDDEELRSPYSSRSKGPKVITKRGKGNDSAGKGHARDPSEESLTRATEVERDGGFVIEVGTPLPDTPESDARTPSPYRPRLGSTSSNNDMVIQATTSVTQSVSRASSERVRKQQSGYYKGDFLGTQVWADQVFPGPKNPAQHVNYGMNLNRQNVNRNNGALAHHNAVSNCSSRRPSHSFADVPSLGVLPSTPPRALLNAIAGRKGCGASHGNGESSSGAAGRLKPYVRSGLKSGATGSEEELGGISETSRTSLASALEEGQVTPGIEVDQQHQHP